MVDPQGNPINHGVIVKLIATNICGSDLHMSATAADPLSSLFTVFRPTLHAAVSVSSSLTHSISVALCVFHSLCV